MWILVLAESIRSQSTKVQIILVAVTLLGSARGVYMPYTYDRITYPPDFYTDIVDLSLSSSTFLESSESDYDTRFVSPPSKGLSLPPHTLHPSTLTLSISLSLLHHTAMQYPRAAFSL